jgi:hypothetical protein
MTTNEMLTELIKQGEIMRSLQKEYFGNRSKEVLNESIKAEIKFDNLVHNIKQLIKN